MRLTYLKLIATVFFWGTNFAAGKIALQSLGPYSISCLRFVLASLLLMAFLYRTNGKFPNLTKSQWGLVLIAAFTGVFLYNVFFFSGMQYMSTVRASLVIAFVPVSVTLGSWLFLKEQVSFVKWTGIVLSIVGAIVVLTRGDFMALFSDNTWGLGELLIMGCVISWTVYTLVGKITLRQMPALTLSAYSATLGALLLLGPALQHDLISQIAHSSWQSLTSVLYMATTATALGFIWYYEAVQQIGATKAAVVGNLTPVFAALIAVSLLGEKLTWSTILGGGLVMLGVWLTAKK